MSMLNKLGIADEASLRNFLSKSNGTANFDSILQIALDSAASNSKYGTWLSKLNIHSVQDLKNLIKGNGTSGNLQSLVLFVAMQYVESNPKYAQYAPFIQTAMSLLGLNSGADGSGDPGTSDDDIIDLGPFNGMTVGEVKAVRSVK